MEKLVVKDNCLGCGMCVGANKEYFEFNDEGLSKAKKEIVDEKDKEELLAIIDACPAGAIVIEEEK